MAISAGERHVRARVARAAPTTAAVARKERDTRPAAGPSQQRPGQRGLTESVDAASRPSTPGRSGHVGGAGGVKGTSPRGRDGRGTRDEGPPGGEDRGMAATRAPGSATAEKPYRAEAAQSEEVVEYALSASLRDSRAPPVAGERGFLRPGEDIRPRSRARWKSLTGSGCQHDHRRTSRTKMRMRRARDANHGSFGEPTARAGPTDHPTGRPAASCGPRREPRSAPRPTSGSRAANARGVLAIIVTQARPAR